MTVNWVHVPQMHGIVVTLQLIDFMCSFLAIDIKLTITEMLSKS